MKKWIAVWVFLAFVQSLCACTASKEEAQPMEKAALQFATAPQIYSEEYEEEGVVLASCSYELPMLSLQTEEGEVYMAENQTANAMLPEPETTVVNLFNSEMLRVMEEKKANYGKLCTGAKEHYALLSSGAREWWMPYEDHCSYSVYATENLLSIYVEETYYTGGVHPNHTIETWNFDLSTGEFLKYEDLAEDGELFRTAISDEILRQIYAQGLKEGLYEDFSSYVRDLAYAEISFEDGGMVVSFEEYTLGPYAAGEQVFLIPYDIFANFLNERGQKLLAVPPEAYILADFHETEELWSYLYVTTLPVDTEALTMEADGSTYCRVEYKGISTIEELKDFMLEHVSEEIAEEWLLYCTEDQSGYGPHYREFNGVLYAAQRGRGSDLSRGNPTYEVRQGDGEGTVVVTVEEYDLESWDEETKQFALTGHASFTYPYVMREGQVIFTAFEGIW